MAVPVRWVCMRCGAIGEVVTDYGDEAAEAAALSHSDLNHACASLAGANHIYFAQMDPYPD